MIRIFEVGPRDGLQNEAQTLPLADKIWLVQGLIEAGARDIELGAFVRPDRVPQMADTEGLYAKVKTGELKLAPARGWALVPNRKGLDRALLAGVKHIAVFTAATESFTQRNIGMSISESLSEFKQVIALAKKADRKIKVRGYVSTVFGCPFEGKVAPAKALRVIEKLWDLGVDQVSIGDTIGVAVPSGVTAVVKPALKMLAGPATAVHFHDTRGTALANALRAIELGVTTVDSSAGGLGGCPFAPGAAGNLATEDLVYMLNGMGQKTGFDLDRLCGVSVELAKRMGRPTSKIASKYVQAYLNQCSPPAA